MFFEIYKSGMIRREWRWRLKAANGRTIASGGEGFANLKDCRSSVELVRRSGTAEIRGPKF